MQGVTGSCTCKYAYAGTAKHPLIHLPDLKNAEVMMMSTLEWVHDKCSLIYSHQAKGSVASALVPSQFNELVANRYDSGQSQSIPWHSDENDLIGEVAACRLEWLEF